MAYCWVHCAVLEHRGCLIAARLARLGESQGTVWLRALRACPAGCKGRGEAAFAASSRPLPPATPQTPSPSPTQPGTMSSEAEQQHQAAAAMALASAELEYRVDLLNRRAASPATALRPRDAAIAVRR